MPSQLTMATWLSQIKGLGRSFKDKATSSVLYFSEYQISETCSPDQLWNQMQNTKFPYIICDALNSVNQNSLIMHQASHWPL